MKRIAVFLILSALLIFCAQKENEQTVSVTPESGSNQAEENLSKEIENLERDLLEIEKLIAELENLEKGFET